jgi:hypothetical protein
MQWRAFVNRAGLHRPAPKPVPDNRVSAKSKGDSSTSRTFKNDPDDPTNPNEVREQHLRNIHR